MEEPMCRTCLATTDGSIFKTVFLAEKEVPLVEMFEECTGLSLSESDGLSLNICDECTEEIIHFYVFRKKCWDSHSFLLQRLEDSRIPDNAIEYETSNESEIVYEGLSSSDTKECELDDSIPDTNDATVSVNVTCELCDRICPSATTFLEHLRNAHNILGYSNYDCKYCKKSYRARGSLRKHIQSVHESTNNNQMNFICQYCGQTFKNGAHMKLHVRRHTGEKPYKCDKCPYRATQITALHMHLRTHTGERPYKCDICGKQFRTISARANHLRGHSEETPFECPVCFRKFKKKEVCREHMIIHNPDQYSECEYCGKKFARRNNLNNHLKQHTGERPYVCKLCGEGFIQKHSWVIHMKNKHNQ